MKIFYSLFMKNNGPHISLTALLLAVLGQTWATHTASTADSFTVEALMPPYAVKNEDSYLCTSVKLPTEPLKLTATEAVAKQEVVHHILVFGAAPLCEALEAVRKK